MSSRPNGCATRIGIRIVFIGKVKKLIKSSQDLDVNPPIEKRNQVTFDETSSVTK